MVEYELADLKEIIIICENKQFQYRIEIAPLDWTGCDACIQACPAAALKMVKRNLRLGKKETKSWEQLPPRQQEDSSRNVLLTQRDEPDVNI